MYSSPFQLLGQAVVGTMPGLNCYLGLCLPQTLLHSTPSTGSKYLGSKYCLDRPKSFKRWAQTYQQQAIRFYLPHCPVAFGRAWFVIWVREWASPWSQNWPESRWSCCTFRRGDGKGHLNQRQLGSHARSSLEFFSFLYPFLWLLAPSLASIPRPSSSLMTWDLVVFDQYSLEYRPFPIIAPRYN